MKKPKAKAKVSAKEHEDYIYWKDFSAAQELVGTGGAYLYAGTRQLIRRARQARQRRK